MHEGDQRRRMNADRAQKNTVDAPACKVSVLCATFNHEEYLRQTLSQREFENDGAQADKIEGVVDKKAERSEKANEAFGDIVAADEANIQSDVQCGE